MPRQPFLTLAVPAAISALTVMGFSTSSRAAPPLPPQTFPADTVGLPINARPVFFGSGEEDATFVRVDADGETPLAFESRASRGDDRAFTVEPGVLAPSTGLFIEGRCNGCSAPGAWNVIDAVDDTPPVFAGFVGVNARRTRRGTAQVEVDIATISIPSLDDNLGPVLVRLVGDGIDQVQPFAHNTGAVDVTLVLDPAPARTLCMAVSAIDIAGNETTLPDEVCASFSGCSQAPTTSTTLLLGCLALFARRTAKRAQRSRRR